jgi:hypothetical protein
MGKGSRSTQSGKQTIVNELPEYARPFYENLMERTEAESLNQYTPYENQRLAQSADFQDITQSQQMVRDVASAGTPEISAAMSGIGLFSRPGQFTGQVADAYMSPYMQSVVDRQKQGAIRDFNRMGAQRGFDAAKAGAFGGSRHGVADYLAQEGLQTQLGDIQAEGQQKAYEQAAQRFDIDRSAGIAGLKDIAGLAGQRRAADIQGAQLLEGIGKQQLAEQQAGLDIGYQDFLRQQGYNKEQLGFMSNILQGIPVQPNQTTTQYQNYNPLQQALGAGIAGLGLYRGMV